MYDAIIVGGGVAGLAGALVLGRARRRVLVIDAGEPRNAPAEHAHSFFTRDGTPPGELLRIGREQAEGYGAKIRAGRVAEVTRDGEAFGVALEDGGHATARRVLIAAGVVDELPEIDGLRERWGRSVFHCPYCHGWEMRDQPLAVHARGAAAMEMVSLILGWTRDVVLCTDGPAELGDHDRAKLARHAIDVREERIVRLEGDGDGLERIVFADDRSIDRAGLFLRPAQHPSPIADRLGCERNEDGSLVLDRLGETSVPGVFAAGDVTRRMQQVATAAAEGATAAAGINHSLLREEFG